MKKIFTLLVGSLFSLSLLAYDGSRLSISTFTSGNQLKVEIDGRDYRMNDNTVVLNNLSQGNHQVTIYHQTRKNNFGFGRRVIVYRNNVFIKRGFHTDITINRFGKAMVDERRIERNDGRFDEDDYYGSDDWDNSYSNVMSQQEFDGLKNQLRNEWFENNRLGSVKFIIDKNNFTTQQVKELMLLFSFESNKLEIAKYAFNKTVDTRNYYQLNEALAFSSSKEELSRFIRQQPQDERW